jgi:hypothetical protein
MLHFRRITRSASISLIVDHQHKISTIFFLVLSKSAEFSTAARAPPAWIRNGRNDIGQVGKLFVYIADAATIFF